MNPQLPQDFKEFLQFLNDEGVQYLLIGGYAVGYHGFPRATADMDIWIDISQKNAERTIEALDRFGFKKEETSTELFLTEGNVVRMGVPPMRIEIINKIDGVDFETCYAAKEIAILDEIEVPIISKTDLIKNKKASGRMKDLADVEGLGY